MILLRIMNNKIVRIRTHTCSISSGGWSFLASYRSEDLKRTFAFSDLSGMIGFLTLNGDWIVSLVVVVDRWIEKLNI